MISGTAYAETSSHPAIEARDRGLRDVAFRLVCDLTTVAPNLVRSVLTGVVRNLQDVVDFMECYNATSTVTASGSHRISKQVQRGLAAILTDVPAEEYERFEDRPGRLWLGHVIKAVHPRARDPRQGQAMLECVRRANRGY